MSQPAASKTSETPATTSTSASPATRDRLATDDGQITVAEGVVQKIAGKACREIAGVHAMGTSGTRAFGAIRERIPGSTGPNVAQGVGVEVGETEAAIDLDIVVEYGVGHRRAGPQHPAQRQAGGRADDRPARGRGQHRRRRCLPAHRRRPGHHGHPGCHDPPPAAGAVQAPRSIDGVDVDAVAAAVRGCAGVSGAGRRPVRGGRHLPARPDGRRRRGRRRPGHGCRSVPGGGFRRPTWPPASPRCWRR